MGDLQPLHNFNHQLHFYDTDEAYLSSLVSYFKEGLEAGEQCIVVATQPHLLALKNGLKNLGLNVEMSEAMGHYIELDAEQTLSHFMLNGMPDEKSFMQVIGCMIPHIATRPIRAFGEMVALLWQAGNPEGAMALEKLWNDLGRMRQFQLLCAYPNYLFQSGQSASEKSQITEKHSSLKTEIA